jgi:hypothetical protein
MDEQEFDSSFLPRPFGTAGEEVAKGKAENPMFRVDASPDEICWANRCSSRKSSKSKPEGISGYGASS